MHESSLVSNLLRQVEEIAAEHGAERVAEVRVEIGLLSGVEAILLREAFGRLKVGTRAAAAELRIDDVGLTCRCRNCETEFSAAELQFVCPRCESRDVTVTGGDSLTLVAVELIASQEDVIP